MNINDTVTRAVQLPTGEQHTETCRVVGFSFFGAKRVRWADVVVESSTDPLSKTVGTRTAIPA